MSGGVEEKVEKSGITDLGAKFEAFKAQCMTGNVQGCHSLAEFYQLMKNDYDQAAKLFADNCDPPAGASHRRYAPSCFSIASMYLSGQPKLDVAKAMEYFDKACVAGSNEACYNLAVMYRRGMKGVSPDVDRAEKYYDQSCSAGNAKSCFGVAALSMQKKESGRALHYFEKSCLLGYPWGCSNAVVMLTNGDGVPKDLERAKRLRELGEDLSRSMGLTVTKV